MDELKQAIKEYRKHLLDNEDVLDGPNGPKRNWAMEACMCLDRILEKHEIDLEE